MLLVIMRGVPGSGKSHSAQRLKLDVEDKGLTCSIHSTDEKFMVNGNYQFDRSKLQENHNANLREAIDSMMAKTDVVIIDNTNIRVSHFMPYVEAGKALHYDIKECQPQTAWWNDFIKGRLPIKEMSEICHRKNVHHVAIETIAVMLESFETWSL